MALNRNAKRSINMIEKSFIEILKEKDISKITVKEITEKADLTRNTFYAHFKDVYQVNRAIQDKIIDDTFVFMQDETSGELKLESIIYFRKVMKYIDEHKDMLNALLRHGTADDFIDRSSDRVLDKLLTGFEGVIVKDLKGLKIFLKILFTGSMYVIKRYLNNEIEISSDELAIQLNSIYLSTYQNYIEYEFKK